MKLKNTLGLAIASLMPKVTVDPLDYAASAMTSYVSREALVYSAALDVLLEERPRNRDLGPVYLCGINVRVDPTMDPNMLRIGQESPFNPAPVERCGLVMHPGVAELYDEWIKQA